MVLLFGEIIPSAIFTGPQQLKIASFLAPFVRGLIFILSPIAYPISIALDMWLGHDDGMTVFNRREIAAMVSIMHQESTSRGLSVGESMRSDQVTFIGGVLKYIDVKVLPE